MCRRTSVSGFRIEVLASLLLLTPCTFEGTYAVADADNAVVLYLAYCMVALPLLTSLLLWASLLHVAAVSVTVHVRPCCNHALLLLLTLRFPMFFFLLASSMESLSGVPAVADVLAVAGSPSVFGVRTCCCWRTGYFLGPCSRGLSFISGLPTFGDVTAFLALYCRWHSCF